MNKRLIAAGLVLAGLTFGSFAGAAESNATYSSAVGSCSGGSGPCTASAVCPVGKIASGASWFIVPDGVNPAYGICGSNAAGCVAGTNSCSITTSIPQGCGSPGWSRQIAQVTIACKK